MEAFSKGNYEQAYKEFRELLLTYSKDPLYQYYAGVCLVKLNRDPSEAITLLQLSLQSVSAVKNLPSDALFYLGRAQQMTGRFGEAMFSYNAFTEQVGKREARDMGIPEFINQCNLKKGAIAVQEKKPPEKVNIIREDTARVEKVLVKQPEARAIIATRDLQPGYDKVLDEAVGFQFDADSLSMVASEKKKELQIAADSQKVDLKAKISENEMLASAAQKSADTKYHEAELILNPVKEVAVEKDSSFHEMVAPVVRDTVQAPKTKNSDNKVVIPVKKQTDTLQKVAPVISKPVVATSFFEVLEKPGSDVGEKILVDPEVSAGLIYRIQIAVFKNPVQTSYFRGITPVYGFRIAGTDKTNYYAGMFRRSVDAKKALIEVKAKGFSDSFVVALFENKPVSADRAAVMEKEWSKKPFMTIVNTKNETAPDTIPPTLLFRVEAIRSLFPLKPDAVEAIEKIAGNRGLDIRNLDDGNIVYMIGNFITFESADEYAGLLIRNGYRKSRVVAWLGKKEIPIETAKQLFDNTK